MSVERIFEHAGTTINLARPHWYPVAPPELTADTPVAQVLVPGLEGLGVPSGVEGQLAVTFTFGPGHARGYMARWGGTVELLIAQRPQRLAAQAIVRHLHVPLIAQIRLDRHVRAVRVADAVAIVAHLFQQIVVLEPFNDSPACFFAR